MVEESILHEWRDLEWPNGIGLDYSEAADYAERIPGQGPVDIEFNGNALHDALNELEE